MKQDSSSLLQFAFYICLFAIGLLGCSDAKTVIPTDAFTEEQKKAIKAEDAKIADEESHGAKKR